MVNASQTCRNLPKDPCNYHRLMRATGERLALLGSSYGSCISGGLVLVEWCCQSLNLGLLRSSMEGAERSCSLKLGCVVRRYGLTPPAVVLSFQTNPLSAG